ncbi:MAG: twin-arginine translocation signal domain-containing protein, partial [Gemmatimonadota bacterium]|nr:twin-arginine translocation signal domain-containing protein [Gemmatimonadota bacterium]
MTIFDRNLSRRGFMKTGIAATAAGGLAGLRSAHAAQDAQADQADQADQENRDPGSAEDPYLTLRNTPTPLIMDALTRIGYDRTRLAMSRAVRPMFPARGTIAGPAVTTKYEESDIPTTRDDIRAHVFRPVDEAGAGSIWVTASGTTEILSMFGDVIVLSC